LYLTIDSKLQTVAEESLERAINSARTGSTFKSQFGDISIGDVGPKAKSGAIVAMDVSSGDVLAMSSFPNYDPNKFAEGISASDYNNYLPKNQNDLLAPNPLLNLATQGAFQPGSTFKLITAMAALESGLNPEYTINDPGVIRMGNRNFADYIWHKSRKGHGIENLYKAIQESCNVYFYIIGSDKNWLTGQDLNLGMGAKKILDYAKKFGLDQETGLEGQLEQRNGKVPSEEQKIEKTKIQMKLAIEKTMKDHFEGIDYTKNNDLFENKVEEIVSWIDEDKPVGRSEAITRLKKLGVKSQYVTDDADYLVFSYINYAKWGVGDTFNLSIGQGENAYNPVQIARYVSAIANGGYLVNVNVVNKSESPNGKIGEEANRRLDKISFKNDKNLEDLKIGMVRVSQQGLAKKAFENFPIKVASKTGTAEKTGKIPTDNEFAYLMSHLASYKVEKDKVIAKYEELKTEKEQELTKNKIEELKKKIASPQTSKDDKEKYEKELKNGVRVKLDNTDKINSFYLRKAIKLLNHKLTNEDIDSFKENYGSFAWCVAFAPADNPKIAVACMIPQGESSSYAVLPIREVLGSYFKLKPNLDKKEADKKSDNDKNRSNKNDQEETNENDHIGSSNNEDRTNGYGLEGVD
ncbi:MAG: penicillin-binding transpeptidase domain-containing protein, partial [Peptostreptococcus anaerobius]